MFSTTLLERLKGLHPKSIDLSLERIQRVLAALGHPERRLPPVVHVAGTNGKGSLIAFLRAICEALGKRVHVYTSPHLISFHERIVLAGPEGGTPIVERIYTVSIPGEANAFSAEALAEIAAGEGFAVTPANGVPHALLLSQAAFRRAGRVLIFGSLYLAGHVLKLHGLRRQASHPIFGLSELRSCRSV